LEVSGIDEIPSGHLMFNRYGFNFWYGLVDLVVSLELALVKEREKIISYMMKCQEGNIQFGIVYPQAGSSTVLLIYANIGKAEYGSI